jgi:ribonuclease HI
MGLRAVFNKPPAGPVNVFSDSVYFLRGISKWIHGWRKRGWKTAEGEDVANQSLWLELDEVVAPHRKQLRWYFVRGHEGVPGNERCDQLAVSFSLGQSQLLFTGHESKYSVDLFLLPKDMSIPENNFSSSKDKPAHSYLSAIGTEVIRHKSWSECEQRVKGRSGARFKKAASAEDEKTILVGWGFKSDHPIK